MIKCETHGKIRGRDARYCPICGRKTVTVYLFPLLKLYLDKAACYMSVGVICGTAILIVFAGSITSGIRGCQQEVMREKQRDHEIAAKMQPAWASLYTTIQSINTDSYKCSAIEKLLKDNPNPGPISADELKIILNTFGSDYYKNYAYHSMAKYTQVEK